MGRLIKFAKGGARIIWKVFKPVTMGARILLIKGDEILLVKHSYEDFWFIPGGGVKKGETYDEGIRREVKEELGMDIGKVELFGVYSNFFEGKNDTVVVFLCEDFGEVEERSFEIEKVAFFSLKDLPKGISLGTKKRIEEYVKGKRMNYGKW